MDLGNEIRRRGGMLALAVCLSSVVSAIPLARCGLGAAAGKETNADIPAAGRRAGAARFAARVSSTLASGPSAKAFWGILVADEDTGETLFEKNDDLLFAPASNAKLFTTALALSILGPGYRYRTTVESQGTLGSDGALHGDLILVGRGDPDLSNRVFPFTQKPERDGPAEKALVELADAVVARGVKDVEGDVVADDSYFPYDPYPAGWVYGDLYFEFGAPLSAIAINENTLVFDVRPGARAGDPAIVTVEPSADATGFETVMITAPAGTKPKFSVVRQPGPKPILLRGMIPLDKPLIPVEMAMQEPAEYAARLFRGLLQARGVRVRGSAVARHGSPRDPDPIPGLTMSFPLSPPNPLVLAEHFSPPLIQSAGLTNKISQNLHAELLLRTVAREKTGAGTMEAGIGVETDFLKSIGVADGDVILSDGSGLARDDLVTPRATVALLEYIRRQPWGDAFIAALPVAGQDGTLENRFRDTLAAGRISAKTGFTGHSRALSGYATTLRGAHIVFSIYADHFTETGPGATSAVDAIAEAMVEDFEPAPHRKK